jgi:hypothetical protein
MEVERVIFIRVAMVFTLQAQRWGVVSNIFLVVVFFYDYQGI